jgi:hypothetical protein
MLLQQMLIINEVTHVPTTIFVMFIAQCIYRFNSEENTREKNLKGVQSFTFLHRKAAF